MTPPITSLHVGVHKTATTHLQRSMMAARQDLLAQGVHVFAPSLLRANGHSLVSRLEGDVDAVRNLFWHDHQRLVISEENFMGVLSAREGVIPRPLYKRGPERIAALARVLAPDGLDVFLCIRDPASFLASAYSQVLLGGLVVPFETFYQTNPLDKVNWAHLARRIMKTEGVRQVTVWRYEDYLPLFGEICTEMMGEAADLVTPIEERVHRGMSEQAVSAMLEWQLAGETGPLAILARETYPVTADAPAFDGYTATDHATSDAIYAKQLRQIAEMPNVRVLTPHAKA